MGLRRSPLACARFEQSTDAGGAEGKPLRVARERQLSRDTVELYSARQRAAYLKQASEELGVEERILKKDLGEVLLRLEERQEQQLKQEKAEKKAAELTEEDQRAALEVSFRSEVARAVAA